MREVLGLLIVRVEPRSLLRASLLVVLRARDREPRRRQVSDWLPFPAARGGHELRLDERV